MNDTTPEAAAVVRAAVMNTAPAERIRRALEMSEQLRALSLSRVRARHPEFSTLRLVEVLSGETLIPEPPRHGDGGP